MTPESPEGEGLAACPGCGETDWLRVVNVRFKTYEVGCAGDDGCGFRGPRISSDDHELAKQGARDAWNRRHSSGGGVGLEQLRERIIRSGFPREGRCRWCAALALETSARCDEAWEAIEAERADRLSRAVPPEPADPTTKEKP